MTLLGEAAALFDRFVAAGWASCHLRTRELDLFVARRPGIPNPLAAAGDPPPQAAAPPLAAAAWLAPHLGTVRHLAPIGTQVAAGDPFGALDLLGEEVLLRAVAAGTIIAHHATVGALVEYDQPLVGAT